ncbi:transcriptional regulator, PadR-like family [Anaeromyxobacter sp. K]|uniref:PadR family transcriptional regulator n=1 Tax=Anaeromyxobacter sp. (strain K) TaxID=447217 RepID=UPI00015F86E5|nr:helix-turn-helix transcriptional regulator [Anaeromyxobacter sp. K]ACG71606.1 transcriptional regulator, PadR-like family [Anaeromyxobacter sp. K]
MKTPPRKAAASRTPFRRGRHAPAFVLLALSRKPSYGLEILEFLERHLPGSGYDSAAVYRTLQALERQGAVAATRDPGGGAARKWYRITRDGGRMLDAFEEDVRRRMAYLAFFLDYRGGGGEGR